MKVSIVIPAFNEERLLGETLQHVKTALTAFASLRLETELIVCDNNSTDRKAGIARAAGAQVVFEPVNQIARARNCGAAAATGDWLLFIDADSHPSVELFAEVAQQTQLGRCLAGGCTIRYDGYHPVANFGAGLWNRLSRSRRLLAGSFIFCDAAAFRQIGGFSNELFAGEELDLSKRLGQLARETGREIVILHRHPLVTSARKMRLYSTWELLRFVLLAGLNQKRVLRSREACHSWYDGRR
ncbi:MAG: glycosyltransferase [Verrucomicrobia bacterium]|nr:glycosyltransferase [Verrucomicrobiota bacterium]